MVYENHRVFPSLKARDLFSPKKLVRSVPETPVPSTLATSEPAPVSSVASSIEEAIRSYDRLITFSRRLFAGKPCESADLISVVDQVKGLVETNAVTAYLLSTKSTLTHYLVGHAVNVSLLAGLVGRRSGLPEEDWRQLVLGGFLLDVGMVPYFPLVEQARTLTDVELNPVRDHPHQGSVWVQRHLDRSAFSARVVRLVSEHQERINSKGYPSLLDGSRLDVLSPLLHVVDTYQAMIHHRAYRPGRLPHQAIREMLKLSASEFHEQAVRTLMDTLSLYPPGSFVKLSHGGVGRVIRMKEGFPTRPVVKLLSDGSEVDLSAMPMTHVEDAVDPIQDPTVDAATRQKLKLSQWWV